MARKTRRLLPPAAGRTIGRELALQQFRKTLLAAMNEKGWSGSDLAAEIWGRKTDKRGYSVAKGRDRISQYLAGKSEPSPRHLKAIADALGTTPEELAPDLTGKAIAHDNPERAMSVAAGHPDKTLLRINMLVPYDIALKVMALLPTKSPATEGNAQSQEQTQ